MEGGITMPIYPYQKNGKEHYYYAFEVKDKDGKRKTIKKRGFKGKTEAKNAEREARLNWDKGTYIDPSKMLYREYVTDWLEKKQDINKKTRKTNEGHLNNHIIPELGHIPLQKINVTHIESFIAAIQKKGLADGTVRKIYNLVQTSFNSAIRKEIISKNPFDLLDKSDKPKTGKPKVDYWTKEEVKTFLKSIENHRHKIIFILAIYTGMRQGEILALRWRDVDTENKQLRISQILDYDNTIEKRVKTDAGYRSVTISDFVVSELKKQRAQIVKEKLAAKEGEYFDNDLVVCRTNGMPVSKSNFHKFWVRKLDKSGVRKIRFHDLRHTCASLLFSAGVHPKVVQELLGHKSIKITLDTYSHMLPNIQSEAVKVLDEMLK